MEKQLPNEDWRRAGQKEYLHGVVLVWRHYTPHREGWDHDHCEFCWAKFSSLPDELHEGYSTKDQYRWICKACFADFQEEFEWVVET